MRGAAIDALGYVGGSKATSALVKALAVKGTFRAATAALVQLYETDATPLLPYLKAAKTVRVFAPIIRICQSGTQEALTTALAAFGYKAMALDYLNCGNPDRQGRRSMGQPARIRRGHVVRRRRHGHPGSVTERARAGP